MNNSTHTVISLSFEKDMSQETLSYHCLQVLCIFKDVFLPNLDFYGIFSMSFIAHFRFVFILDPV